MQSDFLDRHPQYCLVSGWGRIYDERGEHGLKTFAEKPEARDFITFNPFLNSAMMIRTDIFLQMGGYRTAFETTRCEDLDLTLRLYAAHYRGYNLQIPLIRLYEPLSAFKRRKLIYRFGEAVVRYRGMKNMRVPFLWRMSCVFPIAAGIVPKSLFGLMKRKFIYRRQ